MTLYSMAQVYVRHLAAALMAASSFWLAPVTTQAGMLTPGNILVSTGQPFQPRTLSEYSRAGLFVQSFSIPSPIIPIPIVEVPRDVVVTPNGLAHVFNGTGDPFVSTLNPLDSSWTHRTHSGWSTIANTTYGGIATNGQYVFTTDNNTGNGADTLMGVIRFDMVNGTSERFADTIEPIDLNMGLDGLLYVQYPGGSSSGRSVEVYDPVTLNHIRHIFFGLEDEHRSIAVSATGEMYLADSSGDIERYNPDATLINRINVCGISPGRCFLSDIDIAPDGTIIASTTRGRIIVTDLNLSNPHLFPTTFQENPIFVTFVPEPGSAALLGVAALGLSGRRSRRQVR